MYGGIFNYPKKSRDKHITVMNNNLEIYRACHQKMTFRQFCLSTDDPILTGESVRPYNGFKILRFEFIKGSLW